MFPLIAPGTWNTFLLALFQGKINCWDQFHKKLFFLRFSLVKVFLFLLLFFFFFFVFCLLSFWGHTWGIWRFLGWIGATAAGLHHSHSNGGTTSVTYTTAQGNAGSLTHWVRAGIEPASSWILVGFITTEPRWELSSFYSYPINSEQLGTLSLGLFPIMPVSLNLVGLLLCSPLVNICEFITVFTFPVV